MNDTTIEEIRVSSTSISEILEAVRIWVEEAYRAQQLVDEPYLPKDIILRLDVRFNWSFVEQQLVESPRALVELVRERFKSPNLYILYSSNFRVRMFRLTELGAELQNKEVINALRSHELSSIAITSNALYHQFGTHFYRLPSGEVSDFFFRVGNLQAEKSCLDLFWFWAVPYMKDVSHIVCDTWSISTMSAYLASSAQRYTDTEQIAWSYLSGYMVDDDLLQRQLQLQLKRASVNEEKVLFLLSATASGRTQATIQSIAANADISPSRFVVLTLFALAERDSEDATLCEISNSLSTLGLIGVVDETTLSSNERIYQVDPGTYFPMYFDAIVHPFKLGHKQGSHTKASSEFFERYAGNNIFSVCRDGASNRALLKPRHHAFHIDAEKLFLLSEFQKRLFSALEDTNRSYSHVVHLRESADLALVGLIRKNINLDCEFIEVSDYSEIDSDPSLKLMYSQAGATVLFVDSLTISGGSRLERFQIALRRLCRSSDFNPNETDFRARYLIGLARPSTLAKFKRLIDYFPQSSSGSRRWLEISVVEQVLLPDWHSEKCPWCAEKNVLRAVVKKREETMGPIELHYIEKRIIRLELRKGLAEGLFFQRYQDDEFDFEPGSLFLDTSKVS